MDRSLRGLAPVYDDSAQRSCLAAGHPLGEQSGAGTRESNPRPPRGIAEETPGQAVDSTTLQAGVMISGAQSVGEITDEAW